MTALDRITNPAVPTPGILGQATVIEQSRAVAEVAAAVQVAQQCPRDIDQAVARMRRACSQPGLAGQAFYAFPRSGQTVTGPSVYLARELALCWGNIQYGVAELRRDDAAGISEMQAFAWDVETNTRSAQIFIVPHRRDKRGGAERLVDLRDIYENNANQGARRVRQAIYSVLPKWFTEEAEEICRRTLTAVTGEQLAQRVQSAIDQFARGGITLEQLERKVGRPRAEWTAEDVAELGVLFQSLKRKEISRDEAFPPDPVTVAEITTASGERVA